MTAPPVYAPRSIKRRPRRCKAEMAAIREAIYAALAAGDDFPVNRKILAPAASATAYAAVLDREREDRAELLALPPGGES